MAIIDIGELEQELKSLPEKIRDQELVVVEKTRLLDEAKLTLDVAMGMTVLTSKAPNASEKKAKAIVETQEEQKSLIAAKYNLAKEEAGLTYVSNQFISARKIGGIEEKLMNAPVPHLDKDAF